MIDIAKQTAFWRDSAKEDWEVAVQLVESGRTRHGLFFAHLTLEKSLKAIICKQLQDMAPRIHNLSRLAELTALRFDSGQLNVLAEMNAFQIEGRYPESLLTPPTKEEALRYMVGAEKVVAWLMNQL